jgi:hypothetical protein
MQKCKIVLDCSAAKTFSPKGSRALRYALPFSALITAPSQAWEGLMQTKFRSRSASKTIGSPHGC